MMFPIWFRDRENASMTFAVEACGRVRGPYGGTTHITEVVLGPQQATVKGTLFHLDPEGHECLEGLIRSYQDRPNRGEAHWEGNSLVGSDGTTIVSCCLENMAMRVYYKMPSDSGDEKFYDILTVRSRMTDYAWIHGWSVAE